MSALFETCPICGKRKAIMWPEFWVYRRGNTFYCSEMCLETSYVKDRNMIKWAYQKRKEAKKMAKMKKDGTPAKKPGPKPKKMETPEGEIELYAGPDPIATVPAEEVETPEKPKLIEYRVTGISTEAGDFQYFRKQGFLDWTTLDGTAVSMSLAEWAALMRVFPEVSRVLGVEL